MEAFVSEEKMYKASLIIIKSITLTYTMRREQKKFSLHCLFIQQGTWSKKVPSRGDDSSQQQLVDFYKTHCTQRE